MTTFLILAVLFLGVFAIVRLSRVYELTATLRGKREEDISERDNKMNARLMWAFPFAYFGFFIWLTLHYAGKGLPVSASEHGVWLDKMYDVNWVILIITFFITNILLFYFAGKYYFRKDRWAYYYPHNNKWELAWTIVPSIVLIGIIIYGLTVWNRITAAAAKGTAEVELYAKQFDWTARYPGPDGVLGATDFRLINDNNPLGIVTPKSIEQRLEELKADEEASDKKLTEEGGYLPHDKLKELEEHIAHVRRVAGRIVNLRTLMDQDIKERGDASPYKHGSDDLVLKEFHLPVNEEIEVLIRSRDVIHSAYMPHMRAQMNAVPGMTTRLHMKPTITTDSMRMVTRNPVFDYILLCNKICGASHYNMQMALVIEKEGAYRAWLAAQKGFETGEPAKAEVPKAVEGAATTDSTTAATLADTAKVAMTNEQKSNH
ncbi:MAG TPA: cytochrome c oxidase subunit II [Flavobacteriales bacterium]|jgi:cytochrome c oxidase subunit 2|nr:cytochrome c oxidase subunit II [Flavobacteriales bacterium]